MRVEQHRKAHYKMTNDCWAPSYGTNDYFDYFGPDFPEDEPEQCEECKKTTRKKLRKENKKLKKENEDYEKLTAEIKAALEQERNEAQRYKFYFEHNLELDTSCHVCKKPLHKKSCPFCIPTGRKRKRVK